jgi:hypothetical protein
MFCFCFFFLGKSIFQVDSVHIDWAYLSCTCKHYIYIHIHITVPTICWYCYTHPQGYSSECTLNSSFCQRWPCRIEAARAVQHRSAHHMIRQICSAWFWWHINNIAFNNGLGTYCCWLVVYLRLPTPLKNMSSSVGMIIPSIWKNKIHVPNHQPGGYFLGKHNP